MNKLAMHCVCYILVSHCNVIHVCKYVYDVSPQKSHVVPVQKSVMDREPVVKFPNEAIFEEENDKFNLNYEVKVFLDV